MDSDSRAILLVVLLFIASAYFALTETALAAVSKNKIKVLVDKGNKRAVKVSYALDNFEDAITTLLICTNVAHIAAASLVTVAVTRKWGLSAVTASTFVTTIAMFFLGEMLPKSIGKKLSLKACLICDGLLVVLMKLLSPISSILSGIGKITLKLLKAEEDEVSVTEDEIYDIIDDLTEEGTLDEEQSELISSALSFGDVTASSILTPRVDVEGFDINMEPEAILEYLLSQNHSRVVVYDKSIDHIIGVVRLRQFLKVYINKKKIPDIKAVMDEVYYAHQSTPIDELFENMSANRINMAVILDGYGGTLGIVTVEDILEEIVGEIWDESDEITEPIIALTDSVYVVKGDETVADAFDFVSYEVKDDKDDERFTNLLMADFICEHFDEIPKTGDSFNYDNLKITVSKVDNNRILEATVTVEVLTSDDDVNTDDDTAKEGDK